MTRIVNSIISDEVFENQYHMIVTDVVANGKRFIESYFGVNKGHAFYSVYEFIESRDSRYRSIEENVFKKFGCKQYFDNRRQTTNLQPVDGAYLAWARTGKQENESYNFLKDDYFYYGSCLQIGFNEQCNVENCTRDAHLINDRMMEFLSKNSYSHNPTIECLPEDVWKLLKNTSYWGKDIYTYGPNEPISKQLMDENIKVGLYDFDSAKNQKIYYIQGTRLCIRADGMVSKSTYRDDNFIEHICNINTKYSDAVREGLSREGLHEDDIAKVGVMLCDVHRSPYWIKVITKLHRRINSHDRNNVHYVLQHCYGV